MGQQSGSKAQWVDADTAIRTMKKGKRIFVGSGCAEPQHLVKALMNNAEQFCDNEIVHLLTLGIAPYTDPKYSKSFRHNAFFIGPNVRDAIADGHADYTPVFLSEIPNLFKTGQMPIDYALVQVSPPDENNCVSLGISADVVVSAVLTGKIVIAQVNKEMPETVGKTRFPLDVFDYLVQHDEPLLEHASPQELDDVSLAIGKHLSNHISDGDTLQLGIGNIPNAVLKNLSDKNDLGIHSEMVADGVIDLCKNGNVTNKYKGINQGITIVSFASGTRKLYDLVHRNDKFQFYPSEYVNDPFVISQNNHMVSINSALQVDLTGQVCADSIGSQFFSGIGGQVDFVRGSVRSKGGRSFIALPSTAKQWTVSRIVPFLNQGAGVVTSRGDIHYVVTEYGVAYLHGKSIRERGLALTQIAHPKFRDELLDYLKQKHYVYLNQKAIKDDDSPVKELIPFSETFKEKMIYFRTLRPQDEKSIQDFFYSHDAQTIYNRYLTLVESLPHDEAIHRVSVDYNTEMAIAGFDSIKPYAKMVCLGRYIREKEDVAEIGVVVKESYQGLGLGAFLVNKLIEAAKKHDIKKLVAYVSHANAGMMKIFKRQGFEVKESKQIDGYYCAINL